MSDLVVYTYEQEDKAAQVLMHVASLKQENVQKALIGIEDAAVVVKNEKGKVRVSHTLESVVKGTNIAASGWWGLFVGFLFGGPLFGALLAMGFSALFGRNIDIGIDNSFIQGISNDLAPGDSALFLLVNNTPVDDVAEALNDQGGKLYYSSISSEANEVFAKASESEELKTAVAAHNE